MLTDFLRQQFDAYASIPVSTARLLAALADAAEVSVSVLRQLDERAAATNRVLHSFEEPLVRLAEAVDGSLVDSTVDALGRLPAILARAAALTDRADGLIAGLEVPVRALGPLSQAIDVGRLSGLVTRIEETLPGLVRIPEAETEVRRLRETLDRMYRVVDDVQGRFGALPGAGVAAPAAGHGRARRAGRRADRTVAGQEPDDTAQARGERTVNYWWCLKHSRVESDAEIDSKGDDRVGPYPTEERAQNWRSEFQARNERWDEEDREWNEGRDR